jgi:hypothetical protein
MGVTVHFSAIFTGSKEDVMDISKWLSDATWIQEYRVFWGGKLIMAAV